jgi:hypothetical protein
VITTGRDDRAPFRRSNILFAAIAIAGFAGVLVLAWIPVSVAVSQFVVEDTGYYLTTARNVVRGAGVTLDGRNPTNGFHPLWLVILSAEAWLTDGSPEWLFHLALTTCAVLFAATVQIVYRDVRNRIAPWLAAPVAALMLWNYRLASVALGGLETALAGFATVATISYFARSPEPLTLRRAAGLGALVGVASLSRMDALLLGAIVIAWVAVRSLHTGFAKAMAIVAVALAVLLVTLIPWFVFSQHAVHAWLPRSGEAIRHFTTPPFARPWTAPRVAAATRQTVIGPAGDVANVFGVWPLVNAGRMTRLGGFVALAAALTLLAAVAWRERHDLLVRRLLWIPAYAAAMALYYTQFTSNHLRYLYSPVLAMFYFSCAVTAAWARDRRQTRAPAAAVWAGAVALAITTVAGVAAFRNHLGTAASPLGQQALLDDLSTWLAARTQPSAQVGSFNAGMISFFSGRTTVNLDGVMNDNALEALRSGTLCEYVDAQGLNYLADNRLAIEFFLDADRSCRKRRWRSEWQTVHRVARPIDATADLQDFVVMQRR